MELCLRFRQVGVIPCARLQLQLKIAYDLQVDFERFFGGPKLHLCGGEFPILLLHVAHEFVQVTFPFQQSLV